MKMRRSLQLLISAGAMKLRRIERAHRLAKWLRRTLWRAVGEAVLEFSRWMWGGCERFGPPQRIFSVYQALRCGYPKTRGRIVLHDQGSPVVSEDSWMVRGGFNQYAEQPWPIFWSEQSPARLVTESLALLGAGKSLCVESVYGLHGYHNPRLRADPASRFFRLPPPVQLAGNWTSLVSRWVPANSRATVTVIPNHSHWLLDALPRLALVSEFPPDTRILVPNQLAEYQKETLAMLGLLERCRFTSEHHLELEHYYFSAPTAMLACYNPYGVEFLRRAYLPHRDRSFSGPKKFFIRRAGKARQPLNITEVERFFADRGWALVDLEKLGFRQEVELFAEAEAITGIGGSGFTNAVFCQPACSVVQIHARAEGFVLDGYLEWIQQVVGFKNRAILLNCDYDLRYMIPLEEIRRGFAEAGVAL